MVGVGDILALPVGALLGLSLAAPPGPMNAVIAEESVHRGWRAGFRAGLGAVSADLCFFGLALVGVVAVVQRVPAIRATMIGIGGGLMLYFAWDVFQTPGYHQSPESASSTGFRRAFVLAITNPYQLTWWLTAGVALLDPGAVTVAGYALSVRNGVMTVVGFFGGIICWMSLFPAFLVLADGQTDAVRRWVPWLSAVVLAGFGVVFLWTAGQLLFLGWLHIGDLILEPLTDPSRAF